MKALVVARKPAGLYFVFDDRKKYALLRPQKIINNIKPLHTSNLCRSQSNEIINVYLFEEPPNFMERWSGECQRLTPEAFWAVQSYGIKSILIGVGKSFDENHRVERDYTMKLIGLIEGIFHLTGGIHAK